MQFGLERWRRFLKRIAQGREEVGKLLLRPVQNIAREEAAAGTEFQNLELRRTVERVPHFLKLAGKQPSENGVNVA